MRRVTATDARKGWFRLLDDVASGEVVVIERGGERIVLRREANHPTEESSRPAYAGLINAPEADRADEWSWEWRGPSQLAPRRLGPGRIPRSSRKRR